MVTCGIKYWHCIASKKDHRHKNLTISHCSCRIQFFYHKSHTKQHFLTNPYCQLHSTCFNIIPIFRECMGTSTSTKVHTYTFRGIWRDNLRRCRYSDKSESLLLCISWHISYLLRSYPDNFISFAIGRQFLKYILEPCLRNLIFQLHETITLPLKASVCQFQNL